MQQPKSQPTKQPPPAAEKFCRRLQQKIPAASSRKISDCGRSPPTAGRSQPTAGRCCRQQQKIQPTKPPHQAAEKFCRRRQQKIRPTDRSKNSDDRRPTPTRRPATASPACGGRRSRIGARLRRS
jgi:hypothetical protein